jgi:hypothetical protein
LLYFITYEVRAYMMKKMLIIAGLGFVISSTTGDGLKQAEKKIKYSFLWNKEGYQELNNYNEYVSIVSTLKDEDKLHLLKILSQQSSDTDLNKFKGYLVAQKVILDTLQEEKSDALQRALKAQDQWNVLFVDQYEPVSSEDIEGNLEDFFAQKEQKEIFKYALLQKINIRDFLQKLFFFVTYTRHEKQQNCLKKIGIGFIKEHLS